MAVFANIGGWIADTLVGKGLSITTVRKVRILNLQSTHSQAYIYEVYIFSFVEKFFSFSFLNLSQSASNIQKQTSSHNFCWVIIFCHLSLCLYWIRSPYCISCWITFFPVNADNAINRLPWSCFFPNTAESCSDSCLSCVMHGLQSGTYNCISPPLTNHMSLQKLSRPLKRMNFFCQCQWLFTLFY